MNHIVFETGSTSLKDIIEARIQSPCSPGEGSGATTGGEASIRSTPHPNRSLGRTFGAVESCCTVSRGRDMIFSLPVLIYKVSSYLCICPEIWYEHHAT